MNRRLGLLATSAVLATAGVVVPASPASAHLDVCAGTGTATLSTGFGLPLVTSNTASFHFGFSIAACVPSGNISPTATGTVTGACGLSGGSGTTNSGHNFQFTGVGTTWVFTGEVQGTVSGTSDLTAGSCTNKTARRFFINGQLVLCHDQVPTTAGGVGCTP